MKMLIQVILYEKNRKLSQCIYGMRDFKRSSQYFAKTKQYLVGVMK